MYKRVLKYALLIFFSSCNMLFPSQLLANDSIYSEKHVLILHSYHQGLDWTDNITKGIRSVLDSCSDVNLVFEYLDFKRNYNKEHYEALLNLYKNKARQIQFSAIIVSDNFAFDFMLEHSNEFYPDIPVFFCGVNNLDDDLLVDYPNFIGIGERIDYTGTFEAIKKVFPERTNVLLICDNTLTGKAIQKEVKKVGANYSTIFNIEHISDISLEELEDKVKLLGDSDIIYLLVFNRDKNGVYVSYRNGLKHIKANSNVPIFGSWDFYINNGLFGGKIVRGFEQGEYVALLVKRHLDGEELDTVPQVGQPFSRYVFNYNEMKQFNIDENDLPGDSLVFNKPEEKKMPIKLFLAILSVLALILIALIVLLRLRKKRALILEQIVHERTSELKERNEELNNIIIKENKFFSILAHDLRNSIGTLFSFTKLLVSKDNDFKKDSLSKIHLTLFTSAKSTYNLLEDLLYWGKRQFNKKMYINYSDFNISELLESIAEGFLFNQNEVKLNLELIDDLIVKSDKDVCRFIFRNLIQNAVKFSKKEGEVLVSIKLVSDNQVKILVKDHGVGMSEEVIKSIYNKKPILKEGVNGEIGTGLGLPTVLDYIDLLKANLNIVSKEGEGTLFEVSIDLENIDF